MLTKICPRQTCSAARKPQPIDNFGKDSGRPDGLSLYCRPCENARSRERYVERQIAQPKFDTLAQSKRYLVTAAQNATPVHTGFLAALERAAKHLGAELVVIPLRYKNPTSIWSQQQAAHEWWADEVMPYVFNGRKKLNPNLVLVGDVKTQPTAVSPLSGFESLTGPESCILGHTKLQLRTIPVPSTAYPKILTTTGAVTLPNFTDTRAGALGAFHHILGAALVEIQGKLFHLRQINAEKDGSFIDVAGGERLYYRPTKIEKAPRMSALVLGDGHKRVMDPLVEEATFGKGGIVDVCDPEVIIWQDIFHGETVNPHDWDDPFLAAAREHAKRASVEDEVLEVIDYVDARTGGRDSVIVDSNHHDFLRRWILSKNWKQMSARDARFYLRTALAMHISAKQTPAGGEYDDPFVHWVRQFAKSKIRCLDPDESFKIAGIELSLHGHRGPNGAKGSIRNLSRLGVKTFIGHGHGPGIEEGCYQMGTSSFRRQTFMRGPSNALNTHGGVYPNGKRVLLNMIDGMWRLR